MGTAKCKLETPTGNTQLKVDVYRQVSDFLPGEATIIPPLYTGTLLGFVSAGGMIYAMVENEFGLIAHEEYTLLRVRR